MVRWTWFRRLGNWHLGVYVASLSNNQTNLGGKQYEN